MVSSSGETFAVDSALIATNSACSAASCVARSFGDIVAGLEVDGGLATIH